MVKKTQTQQMLKTNEKTKKTRKTNEGDIPRAPIVTGSMCTGMGMDMLAWEEPDFQGVPVVHAFGADNDKHCRAFIRENFPNLQMLFDDATSKEFMRNAPSCDVLSAGFPCPGFSVAGNHLGIADPRSVVLHDIIAYVRKYVPKLVILENVKGLLDNHGKFFLALIKLLKHIKEDGTPAYWVHWKVLNSMQYGGVPQHRERIYIVCTKKLPNHDTSPFKWPEPVIPTSLEGLFDADGPKLSTYSNYPLPPTSRTVMRHHVKQVLHKALSVFRGSEERLLKVPMIIHGGGSKPHWHMDKCMTITKTHAMNKTYWSLQHGRPLTTTELARLQGVMRTDRLNFSVISERQMNARIGNAYTLTVYKAVLLAGLQACGLMP